MFDNRFEKSQTLVPDKLSSVHSFAAGSTLRIEWLEHQINHSLPTSARCNACSCTCLLPYVFMVSTLNTGTIWYYLQFFQAIYHFLDPLTNKFNPNRFNMWVWEFSQQCYIVSHPKNHQQWPIQQFLDSAVWKTDGNNLLFCINFVLSVKTISSEKKLYYLLP